MGTLIKFLPFDASFQVNCIAWGKGISDAIASFGWVKTIDEGQVNWSTMPAVFDKDIPSTWTGNFRGAYDPALTYTGTTSDSQICDVVTFGGATWISVVTGNIGNTPGTDVTKWRMYNYEIWKSTDALSATNPIYFKIVYAGTEIAGTPRIPRMFVTISTATDGNGNPAGNIWNQPLVAPALGILGGYGVGQLANLFECDFSGDTGRLCFVLWRSPVQAGTMTCLLNIERSHDHTGADTDAYATMCTAFSANIGSGLQQTIFKPGTGSVSLREGPHFTTILLNGGYSSYALADGIPAFPIFPLVGAVGNPLLGIILQCYLDSTDGALVDVSTYGTTHRYLLAKQVSLNGAMSNSNGSAIGIRWE